MERVVVCPEHLEAQEPCCLVHCHQAHRPVTMEVDVVVGQVEVSASPEHPLSQIDHLVACLPCALTHLVACHKCPLRWLPVSPTLQVVPGRMVVTRIVQHGHGQIVH